MRRKRAGRRIGGCRRLRDSDGQLGDIGSEIVFYSGVFRNFCAAFVDYHLPQLGIFIDFLGAAK
jgi:hypothetical protein